MKDVKFYDVKSRGFVTVAAADCFAVVYNAGTSKERYAAKAVSKGGTNLTKFLSKKDYDDLAKVAKPAPKKCCCKKK